MADLLKRLDYRNWFIPGTINNPCFPAMDNNIQCQACVESCSAQAITKKWGTIKIDPDRCTYCGQCYFGCPGDLIGIQGLDKMLIKIKRDREKGATTIHPYCDRHRHGDVAGAVRFPTYHYLSPEVLFWTAALGYTSVAMPNQDRCKGCAENCYPQFLTSLETVNSWLRPWNKQLTIKPPTREEKPTERQISRRELFTGLGRNVKQEVTELVVEELENRLTMVLPRTEQGYMRRQTLKAMTIKLLPEIDDWPSIGQYPHIAEACTGCRVCSKQCPTRAINYEPKGLTIKPWLCNGCKFCVTACPHKYIEIQAITKQQEYFKSQSYQFAVEA